MSSRQTVTYDERRREEGKDRGGSRPRSRLAAEGRLSAVLAPSPRKGRRRKGRRTRARGGKGEGIGTTCSSATRTPATAASFRSSFNAEEGEEGDSVGGGWGEVAEAGMQAGVCVGTCG